MKHELGIMVFVASSIIITSLFMIHPAFATGDIGSSRINPSSPLYFLKGVREILELKFAGTTKVRALRQLEFATRRIREVKSLGNTSRQDLIEPTLERYAWHLQELKGIVHPKDIAMVNKVNEQITFQLNALQEVFKVASDPKAKRSIRLAVFRISEKFAASRPAACNFLSKEASSSALNEVEKVVLKERTDKCYNLKLF
ncbi:MAG: DUF5667 domain-containing protein [Patescibacteria group bacterium]